MDMESADAALTSWRASSGKPGTRHVGAFTKLPGLIRELGVDPAELMRTAGLPPTALDDPKGRVSYGALLGLLNLAAGRTGCPHLGLLAGSLWQLGDLGLLGELMRNAPTVGEAIDQLLVHHHLNSEGSMAFLAKRDAFVDFGYTIYVPFEGSVAQIDDAVLAAGMNFMRELCGESWRPTEVLFARVAVVDDRPYRKWFDAPLRFNAGYSALRFPAALLARPIEGADPQRLHLAQEEVARRDHHRLDDAVHRAVRRLLLHGRAPGVDVAEALSLHRRTLNRRLASEGTTFQRVLDRVRLAVAQQLLDDTRLTQPVIAEILGYRDEVSFLRAFRRWTGSTPGAWRRRPARAPAGRR